MDIRLYSVKNTLNEIEVHGKDNLDRLLGCIWTIEKLIEEEKETATSSQEGEITDGLQNQAKE